MRGMNMKVSELIEALEQFDDDADVVISMKTPGLGYYEFKVVEHEDSSFERGGMNIVALEVGKADGRDTFVTLEDGD
jgi:hypothetical protein